MTQHTFELGKALTELKTAHTRLIVIANGSKYGAKKLMQDMARSVDRALKMMTDALPNKYFLKVLEDQLLNDDSTLQVEAVKDMFIALPQGIRDEVEKYLEARYEVYAKKAGVETPAENTYMKTD